MALFELPLWPMAHLIRRDACSDAFGAGWISSTCTPGSTLCCVREDASLPQCVQQLNVGWCCTENGGCYADLTSACGQPAAVSCTSLAAGTSQACCPQYTTCASGYNYTDTFVRCNIPRTNLFNFGSSVSTLSGASTVSTVFTSTSLPIATSIATSSSTQQTSSRSNTPSVPTDALTSSSPQPDVSRKSSLSTGAVAGIAVGAAVGALILTIAALFCLRQRRQRPRDPISGRSEKGQRPFDQTGDHWHSDTSRLGGYGSPREAQELVGEARFHELGMGQTYYEPGPKSTQGTSASPSVALELPTNRTSL